jgi:diguanylate cyclase (GGDEF)-like protein
MESAAAFLEQGLALARPLGDHVLISACLYTQGWLFYFQGALVEAIGNFNEAITLRLNLGEEIALANTYNAVGFTYRELGDYDQALGYYTLARELHCRVKNTLGEGHCLDNLGTLENDRGSHASAHRYFHEARECARLSGNLNLEVATNYNIAHTFILMDQPRQAIPSVREARRCARQLDHPSQLSSVRFLQGVLYYALGRFSLSERFLLTTLTQARDLQDNQLEIRVLSELGQLYLKWGRLQEAQGYLEQGLQLGTVMQADLHLQTCHENLVKVREQQHNFERALFHHREFYRLERARFNATAEKQRLALRMSLDIERTERESVQQQQRNAELEELTRRDSMTGLYNHRAFQEILRDFLSKERPLALLLLDVDQFKSYNDTYGHPSGDAVLQRLAQVLQESIRTGDIAARYGGEEFALIILGDSLKSAQEIATRLGAIVREASFPHRQITVSIGGAVATAGISPDRLIMKADAALYQAKHAGRDRCEYAA